MGTMYTMEVNFGGHKGKFQWHDMKTIRTMEVNFGATIGYLHDPYRANSVTIWGTISGDSSEVRNGQVN